MVASGFKVSSTLEHLEQVVCVGEPWLWILCFSIYTLSDLGVLSNLIVLLSLANEHYSPPTE